MQAHPKALDTIWFFEKEKSKTEKDEMPVYEGTIIEYVHKIKVGMINISFFLITSNNSIVSDKIFKNL